MKHEGFTLMDDNDIKHSMDAKTSTKTHFNETFTSMKKIEFTNGMHQHPFFDQFIKVDRRFKDRLTNQSFSKIVRERFDARMVAREDATASKSTKKRAREEEETSTDDDDDEQVHTARTRSQSSPKCLRSAQSTSKIKIKSVET